MAYSCHENNPYHACKKKLFYPPSPSCPYYRPRPCRSVRCESDQCRAKYAEKESEILAHSFSVRPANFASTLNFTDHKSTSWFMMQRYLRTFTQKMSNYRKKSGIAIKHDIRIEFTGGEPHCHLTIMTSANWSDWKAKQLVRGWWKDACHDRDVCVDTKTIRTDIGYGKYITKDLRNRSCVERPPEEWNSRKCHLVRTSPGFLIMSKRQIWKKLCAEWFHNNNVPQATDHGEPVEQIE